MAGLHIVEVAHDKEELLAHAVRRVRDFTSIDPSPHTQLYLADRLFMGEGGEYSSEHTVSGLDHHPGEWQRIIVRNLQRETQATDSSAREAVSVLEFTVLGRRARADAMQVAIDRQVVKRLIEDAVRDARPSHGSGDTLYELLLPNDLKAVLAGVENLQLIIDENTADLPWETLSDRSRSGGGPPELALRGGFLRQLRDTKRTHGETRPAQGLRALVIGNPPTAPGAQQLSGASVEAMSVVESLRTSLAVEALVWDEAGEPLRNDFKDMGGDDEQRVLNALHSGDWRT